MKIMMRETLEESLKREESDSAITKKEAQEA